MNEKPKLFFVIESIRQSDTDKSSSLIDPLICGKKGFCPPHEV